MSKKFIGIFAVLIVAIGVLGYNTYTKKENLIVNGKSQKALIEKITTNTYDNELSPSIENIHIKYKYIVNTKEFIKTQEISRHEHDLYFAKTGKKGDSIVIIYDPKSPANSEIKKIK